MEDLNSVVQWVTTGGAVAVVSWFVSWLLEDFDWWKNIKSQYKKLIILGAALLIGIGAQYLKLNPEVFAAIKPYLDGSVLVIGAWIATQVAHKADK